MGLAEVRLQEGESGGERPSSFQAQGYSRRHYQGSEASPFYLKPGEKRRVKQALARKRARKKLRKESDGIRN